MSNYSTKSSRDFNKQILNFKKQMKDRLADAVVTSNAKIVNGYEEELHKGIELAKANYFDRQGDHQVERNNVATVKRGLETTFYLVGNDVKTRDGTIVNDMYFLNYGYGYVGLIYGDNTIRALQDETNEDSKWGYDVEIPSVGKKPHWEDGWVYRNILDELGWSNGIEGFNFQSHATFWLDKNFDKIIKECLERNDIK